MTRLTVGSLCTGYGGIELGLALAGIEVDLRWYSEIEPGPASLLALDHPGVLNLGDMTAVRWPEVERVDLIAGGIPCQPTSAAGRQLGENDPRWLWPATHAALAELRPRLFLLENVGGLVSHNGGALWQGIIADLLALGYSVRWLMLGACAVGLAHHRHRVFLLAERSPTPIADRLDVPTCGARSGRLLATPLARDVKGGTVEPRHRAKGVGSLSESLALLPTPVARDGSGRGTGDAAYWQRRRDAGRDHGMPLDAAVALLPTPSTSNAHGNHVNGRGEPLLPGAVLMPTPRASDGVNGGPNQRGRKGDLAMPSAVQPERFGQYAAAIDRHETALECIAPEPTEPNKNGRPRLRPEFVEWLMGVPAGHVAGRLERGPALKALGNGVSPPQLAQAWRYLTGKVPTDTVSPTVQREVSTVTTPTNLAQLAELLRDQAPKRNAKRQPELVDIPGPALTKLAAALDLYVAAEPGLALPQLLAELAPAPLEAESMRPIVGSDALAAAESVSAAQDSIDATKYGFRAPWPTPLGLTDDEPRTPAELAEAFAPLALPLPPLVEPTGLPSAAAAAGAAELAVAAAEILSVGDVRTDLDGDDWLRDPGAWGPPGHPAESGHYAPGSQAYAAGKGEAGLEPAYRLNRSVTQLTSYLECGLRYKARYVDKVHETPAVWLAGGLAFHEVARQFETGRAMDDGLMSPDEAAKQFGLMLDAQVETIAAKYPDVPTSQWRAANQGRETLQWWYDKGGEMAAQYVTHALRSGDRPLMLGNDAPALELKLSGPLGGTRVVGYLDHVAVNHAERRIKIKDYKTGSRLPTDPAQLLAYAGLLRQLPGDLLPHGYEIHGEYWAARKATVAGSRQITPAMIATTADRFADFDRAERSGLYMPAPNAMVCAGCPIKAKCPVMGSAPIDSSALAFDA